MSTDKRKYQDGAQVLVYRPNRDQWVPGEVFGYDEAKDTYFVQLSGYTAAQASDPNCWYPEASIRRG